MNDEWQNATFLIQETPTFSITVNGRDRWALEQLIKAGSRGCTPIDNPAPRWSGYIHNLRNMGAPITTHTEPHKGAFAGTHARYELQAVVVRLGEGEAA